MCVINPISLISTGSISLLPPSKPRIFCNRSSRSPNRTATTISSTHLLGITWTKQYTTLLNQKATQAKKTTTPAIPILTSLRNITRSSGAGRRQKVYHRATTAGAAWHANVSSTWLTTSLPQVTTPSPFSYPIQSPIVESSRTKSYPAPRSMTLDYLLTSQSSTTLLAAAASASTTAQIRKLNLV